MGLRRLPATVEVATASLHAPGRAAGSASRRGMPARRAVLLAIGLATVAALAYVAYEHYRLRGLARVVRQSFAERRYERARGPLRRWLEQQPSSGEASYYQAWLALVDDRADEAAVAIERATRLGYDPKLMTCMTAVYQARAKRINEAEPVLAAAFQADIEPRVEVAKELARIYLTSYRLGQAAPVIERWKVLSPEDPQPYLWTNEIASRSDSSPSILIRNYRAALERDPDLDKARLGLAEELSKDRRFDEAEEEFRTYLAHKPRDTAAIVGLGRNAFQAGDIETARRRFEAALEVDPRQPDALKELALSDLRLGQYRKACERYELLIGIDPYDHQIRYSYSQALRLAGDEEQSRAEAKEAARLRGEQDRIFEIRQKVLKDSTNLTSRFEVARWMLENGHEQEGLKWAKDILRAEPRHAPVHRLLADYYQKRGDPGLANYHRLMASTSSVGK